MSQSIGMVKHLRKCGVQSQLPLCHRVHLYMDISHSVRHFPQRMILMSTIVLFCVCAWIVSHYSWKFFDNETWTQTLTIAETIIYLELVTHLLSLMQEAHRAGVRRLACWINAVCAKVEVGKLAEEEVEAFRSIVKKKVHTVMLILYFH